MNKLEALEEAFEKGIFVNLALEGVKRADVVARYLSKQYEIKINLSDVNGFIKDHTLSLDYRRFVIETIAEHNVNEHPVELEPISKPTRKRKFGACLDKGYKSHLGSGRKHLPGDFIPR